MMFARVHKIMTNPIKSTTIQIPHPFPDPIPHPFPDPIPERVQPLLNYGMEKYMELYALLNPSMNYGNQIYLFSGGPLAGKTTLIKNFVNSLKMNGHDVDSMIKIPSSLSDVIDSPNPSNYNINSPNFLIDNCGTDTKLQEK